MRRRRRTASPAGRVPLARRSSVGFSRACDRERSDVPRRPAWWLVPRAACPPETPSRAVPAQADCCENREQMTELRPASTLLRPGGREKADVEHGLQHRGANCPIQDHGPNFGQADQQVVGEQQQQPGKRRRAKHRQRSRQPDRTASRFKRENTRSTRRSSIRQTWRGVNTVAQYALEDAGIVRGGQLAGARTMQVVEAREPETERRRAQQRRPHCTLVGRNPAQRVVRADHRRDPLGIQRAGIRSRCGHAPVVDRDRQVVERGRRSPRIRSR